MMNIKLYIICLISLCSLTVNGQSNLNKLFFVDLADSCFISVQNQLFQNEQFEFISNQDDYNHSVFKNIDGDTFGSDSAYLSVSQIRNLSHWKETSCEIRLSRYFSDPRLAHRAYNQVLEELLSINYSSYSVSTGMTDTTGTLLSGARDIITSTGFVFSFDSNVLHRLHLSIDYRFTNGLRKLKDEWVLVVEYQFREIECKK